jgi:hypothetical protein
LLLPQIEQFNVHRAIDFNVSLSDRCN